MTSLEKALVHINTSLPLQIDDKIFLACIRGTCSDPKWRAHILSFFLETPVGLIHGIVLSGAFTFKELMDAQTRWKAEEYADGRTTEWIKEMAYLSMGRAVELGIAYFIRPSHPMDIGRGHRSVLEPQPQGELRYRYLRGRSTIIEGDRS